MHSPLLVDSVESELVGAHFHLLVPADVVFISDSLESLLILGVLQVPHSALIFDGGRFARHESFRRTSIAQFRSNQSLGRHHVDSQISRRSFRPKVKGSHVVVRCLVLLNLDFSIASLELGLEGMSRYFHKVQWNGVCVYWLRQIG
jgi:hypothetical protein